MRDVIKISKFTRFSGFLCIKPVQLLHTDRERTERSEYYNEQLSRIHACYALPECPKIKAKNLRQSKKCTMCYIYLHYAF